MKVKNNIAVSDNGFVFNPGSGESFTVNPVGLDMLNCMRKGMISNEIAAAISGQYEVDATQAERDLIEFSEMLRQYRLLESEDE
jgi:hypothetical protein